MSQTHGYALLRRAAFLLSEYEARWITSKNTDYFRSLRAAFPSICPSHYRGTSRRPLLPYPSLDASVIEEFEQTGCDMRTNAQARRRFCEIIGDDWPLEDHDHDLLPDLAAAQEVYSLLDSPADYEIVSLSRGASDPLDQLMGFDIGYWGGDHFSLICDTVIMPMWHPPDLEDLAELSSSLRSLNSHVLFPDTSAAEVFRVWYTGKPWAEHESRPGEFCTIRIGMPWPAGPSGGP